MAAKPIPSKEVKKVALTEKKSKARLRSRIGQRSLLACQNQKGRVSVRCNGERACNDGGTQHP